jgi:hypothetical protein
MPFRSTDLMIDVDVRAAVMKRGRRKRPVKWRKCRKACSRTNQPSRCKAGSNTAQFTCTSKGAADATELALLLADLKRLLIEAGDAA